MFLNCLDKYLKTICQDMNFRVINYSLLGQEKTSVLWIPPIMSILTPI